MSSGFSSADLANNITDILTTDLPRFTQEFQRLTAIVDSDSEPFKSKYAARDVIVVIRDKLKELATKEQNFELAESALQTVADLGYLLGIVLLDCEERTPGEQILTESIDIMERRPNENTVALL
ncbi:MAG: hypothetical protein EZS28_042177, partial [Streblomastix strix]